MIGSRLVWWQIVLLSLLGKHSVAAAGHTREVVVAGDEVERLVSFPAGVFVHGVTVGEFADEFLTAAAVESSTEIQLGADAVEKLDSAETIVVACDVPAVAVPMAADYAFDEAAAYYNDFVDGGTVGV
jgi:hypothetical protein